MICQSPIQRKHDHFVWRVTRYTFLIILVLYLSPILQATYTNIEFINKIKACKSNQWQNAVQIIEQMPEVDRFAISSAITICGRDGQWQKALELFGLIQEPDLPLQHAILGALQKSGQGNKAEELLCTHRRNRGCPDQHSINLVLLACRHDWESAVRVLKLTKTWMMETTGEIPELSTYISVIRACGDDKAFDHAFSVIREMRSHYIHGDNRGKNNEIIAEIEGNIYRQFSKEWLLKLKEIIEHDNQLPAVDKDATTELICALGCAADEGIMPSFSLSGARSGYTIDKLVSRTSRIADLLLEAFPSEHGSDDLYQMLSSRIISLGGGPGFDFLGACLLGNYILCAEGIEKGRLSSIPIDTVVLDYEPGWREYNTAMLHAVNQHPYRCASATEPSQYTSRFGTCDITMSLYDPTNAELKLALGATEDSSPQKPVLVIAAYVVAENALLLRRQNFELFRNLLQISPIGSAILFVETTHRLWPEILQAAYEGADADATQADLQVSFPRVSCKRGFAMCIRKVSIPLKECSEKLPLSSEVDSIDWLISRMRGSPEKNIEMVRMFHAHNEEHQQRLHNQATRRQADLEKEILRQQRRMERKKELLLAKDTAIKCTST